jgi:phospholipid-transporting ATPase
LCHTIIIEKVDGQVNYNASSPDELALINFAKYCGVSYLGINEENIMEVKFEG